VMRTKFYLRLFETFAEHTTKYRTLPNIIADRILERCRPSGVMRVLDVGCGPGQLSVPLVASIAHGLSAPDHSNGARLQYVGIDPDTHVLDRLRTGLDSLQRDLHGRLEFKLIRTQAQDSLRSREFRPGFDVVLCSHMLYYVSGWRRMTRQLMCALASKGMLCVVLSSSVSTIEMVSGIAASSGVIVPRAVPMASEYGDWLRERGIAFSEDTHQSLLSVKGLAAVDRNTAGTALAESLAFLMGTENARALLDVALQLLSSGVTEFPLVERIFWISNA